MSLVGSGKYITPPRSAMEVFEMLPEGTLAEVINNTIYMSPAPSFQHQDVLGDLYTAINVFVKSKQLGKCVVAPVDVYFDKNNAFQPDIIFISNNRLDIIQEGKVKGAPDIIVEVLSPDKKYDLEFKKAIYEKYAVKEYFVVDPSNKNVSTFYHSGKKYISKKSKKGQLTSALLDHSFTF